MPLHLCFFHQAHMDGLVGRDEYDQGTRNDLPRFMNPDVRAARKRARAWLATQPDAHLAGLDYDRTMERHTHEMMDGAPDWTDTELDEFDRLSRRAAQLHRELRHRQQPVYED